MQSLNALSLTSTVRSWLTETRQPRILHVFERACNLINERGEVLSVVTGEIGNGPFNLVVGDDFLFSEYLNVESSVSTLAGRLMIGDLTFDTEKAKPWNPCPNWEELHGQKENILVRLKQLTIANIPSSIPQFPTSLVSSLTSALVSADVTAAKPLASQLAGLGIGLTPSGDDFIMGALLGTWIIHPFDVANALAEEIANAASPLTTSLSAAWIRFAGRGEAGILWHELFDSLLLPDADLQSPISRILSVGETSGADALAGFFGVFAAFKERIIGECPS